MNIHAATDFIGLCFAAFATSGLFGLNYMNLLSQLDLDNWWNVAATIANILRVYYETFDSEAPEDQVKFWRTSALLTAVFEILW